MLIKFGTGFTITLEVDEKFLDVESHSLMLVNLQNGTSFDAIQLSALSPPRKDFLASLN